MAKQFEWNKVGQSGDWKCVVYNEPWNLSVKVFLINERDRKVAKIENGQILLTDLKEGVSEPFFTVPMPAWKAIQDAMGNVEPQMILNDGELNATKYHLEDMRKLLKLI